MKLLSALALAAAAALAGCLQAQTTYRWTPLVNGNASGSWNTAGNWNPSGPAAGVDNTAQFTLALTNATTPGTVTLDGNRTIGNLLFGNTSPSNQAWTVNAGTPTTSALTLGTTVGQPVVTVTNQTATINAPVTAAGGVTKSGAGTLVLGAPNTFSGSNYVAAGSLQLNSGNALSGSSAVGVAPAARLTAGFNGTYANVPIFLSGTGPADGRGAVYIGINSANVVLPQDITLLADSRIGAYSGAGTYTLSGVIGGATNLTLWSGGGAYNQIQNWVLSGASTYSGNTTFEASFGAGQNIKLSGGPNRLPTTSRVTLNTTWNDSSSRPVTGTLDLQGNNQTLAGLTVQSGSKTNVNNLISSSANMPTLTINGGGASTINFAVQSGVPVLNISNITLNVNTEAAFDLRTIIQNGATINLQSGTYNSSFYTVLGRTGSGTLNVTNGLFTNTGELLMAYGGNGVGIFNVGGAGVADTHFIRLGNTTPGSSVNLNAGGTIRTDRIYTDAAGPSNSSISTAACSKPTPPRKTAELIGSTTRR